MNIFFEIVFLVTIRCTQFVNKMSVIMNILFSIKQATTDVKFEL